MCRTTASYYSTKSTAWRSSTCSRTTAENTAGVRSGIRSSCIWPFTRSGTDIGSQETNVFCERFHRTVKEQLYSVAFRKTLYESLEQLQRDVDAYLSFYNYQRAHQGYRTQGRTPYQAFLEGVEAFRMKVRCIVPMNREPAENILLRRGQRYSRVRFGFPMSSSRTMRIHLARNEKFRE